MPCWLGWPPLLLWMRLRRLRQLLLLLLCGAPLPLAAPTTCSPLPPGAPTWVHPPPCPHTRHPWPMPLHLNIPNCSIIGFPLSLVLIVFCGGDLFTGNCFYSLVALLEGKPTGCGGGGCGCSGWLRLW